MKSILSNGISSNMLKTIAIIAMVIDHVGFYFEPFLNTTFMLVCRYIGRMAMPIFTYLVVQGFFHTKDFKKYLLRIGIWSLITQIAIFGLITINIKYVEQYTAASYLIEKLNILFIYVVSLIIMKILHKDLIVKKWDYNKNLSLKLICIVLILVACVFLPVDYNKEVPILTILFYFIEKLKITFMIKTEFIRNNISKMIKLDENTVIHVTYVVLIFMSILLTMLYFGNSIFTLLAIIPIALYNGELGKKSKILKNIYYFFFPMHHVALYSLAMLIMLT